jgi:hypothetical protein
MVARDGVQNLGGCWCLALVVALHDDSKSTIALRGMTDKAGNHLARIGKFRMDQLEGVPICTIPNILLATSSVYFIHGPLNPSGASVLSFTRSHLPGLIANHLYRIC